MFRIGFSGVPSTGKTSTARVLAGLSRKELVHVELVNEYARKHILEYGPIESVTEQALVLDKQTQWEDSVPDTIEFLITDSPIFMGFLYCLNSRQIGVKSDELYFNHVFKKMGALNRNHRYDIIFHLPPTSPVVDDGVRDVQQLTDDWREEADKDLQMVWRLFPPKHLILVEEDTIEDRVAFCLKKIKELSQ